MGNNTSRNDTKATTSYVKSAVGGHSSVPSPPPPPPPLLTSTITTTSSAAPTGLSLAAVVEEASRYNNGHSAGGNRQQTRIAPTKHTTKTTSAPLTSPLLPSTSSAAAAVSAAVPPAQQRPRQSPSAWSFGSLSGRLNWSFSGVKTSFRNRRKSFTSLSTTTSSQQQQQQQQQRRQRSQAKWHKPITNAIFSTHFKEAARTDQLHIERLVAKGAFGVVFKVTDKRQQQQQQHREQHGKEPFINPNDVKLPLTARTTKSTPTATAPPPPPLPVYALKVLRKSKIIEENSVQQIKDEADIQKLCGHHPFIVRQVELWQNRRYLHILSEYVPNGELFSAIRSFSLDLVRLYLAEIALAIDFLHNAGVIYRDAKPENILLTADYHIKLTDFGLSKWLRSGATTRTMCGTFQYMAPEILRGESYGHAVDWWSLGIIVCQMLLQKSPDVRCYLEAGLPSATMSKVLGRDELDEAGQNQHELVSHPVIIDRSVVEFSTSTPLDFLPDEVEQLPHEARDVLRRLLDIDPKKRIHSVLALQKIALYKNFKIDSRHVLSMDPMAIIRRDGIDIMPRDDNDNDDSAFANF